METEEDGESDALLPITLPCGHSFHRGCIEAWANGGRARTCPACRASIPRRNGGSREADEDGTAEGTPSLLLATTTESALHIIAVDLRAANIRGLVIDLAAFMIILSMLSDDVRYSIAPAIGLLFLSTIVTYFRLGVFMSGRRNPVLLRRSIQLFEHLLMFRCSFIGIFISVAVLFDGHVTSFVTAIVACNCAHLINDVLFTSALRLSRSVMFTLARTNGTGGGTAGNTLAISPTTTTTPSPS